MEGMEGMAGMEGMEGADGLGGMGGIGGQFWGEDGGEFGYGANADGYDSDSDSDDEFGIGVKKRKKNNADEDMVVRAPRGVATKYGAHLDDDEGGLDGDRRGRRKRGDRFSGSLRESIKDLSKHYNKAVSKKRGKNLVEWEDEDDYVPLPKKKRPPPPPKKKKFVGSANLRYMGRTLPVLWHEPFDDSNPSTWVRRHPEQYRVLEGTTIGRAKVAHYKRPTVEAQLEEARQRFSVRSMYKIPDRESLTTKRMFGHDKVLDRKSRMAKAFNYNRLRNRTEEEEPSPKKKGKKAKNK